MSGRWVWFLMSTTLYFVFLLKILWIVGTGNRKNLQKYQKISKNGLKSSTFVKINKYRPILATCDLDWMILEMILNLVSGRSDFELIWWFELEQSKFCIETAKTDCYWLFTACLLLLWCVGPIRISQSPQSKPQELQTTTRLFMTGVSLTQNDWSILNS